MMCILGSEEFVGNFLQRQLRLDLGESEAITLADTMNADLIIIDERKSRSIAKDVGLRVTGTLGILVEAKRQGFIKELDRKSTRLNSSHVSISYAVFCLKKKRIVKRQRI